MADQYTADWKCPRATARERVAAIWRHFAPTSGKYMAMCEAMERALDEHAADARREAMEEFKRALSEESKSDG